MTRQPVEWNASVYHRVSDPHITWGARALARLNARGDETALDCGCGTGRLTAELLERLPNGRVIAIDRSRNMLEAAQAYLEPTFGDQVSFLEADLQTLTVEELGAPVDLIFSTAALHWVTDHPRLFRNFHGMLKPGGWLVAQCGGGPNIARLLGRAATLQEEPRYRDAFSEWPGPWEFASAETTAARLADAGFVDIETDVVSMPVTMDDASAFREFLTHVIFGTHLARIPSEEDRIAYVEELTEHAAKDDPAFELDYWRLNMRARRPQ